MVAKVANVLVNENWSSIISYLSEGTIKEAILKVKINTNLGYDRVFWKNSKSGNFFIKATYFDLSLVGPKVP